MSKSKKRTRGKARIRDQKAKRAKKSYARKTQGQPKERRWLVGLTGGVVTTGAYGLNVRGGVYVMAFNEAQAIENAKAVMSHMHREGLTLPDDGLDLEIVKARPAGFKGPVLRLQDLAGYEPPASEPPVAAPVEAPQDSPDATGSAAAPTSPATVSGEQLASAAQ